MFDEELVELFEDGYFPEMVLSDFGGISEEVHTAYDIWLDSKRQLVNVNDIVEFSFNYTGYPMMLLRGIVEKKYKNSVLIKLDKKHDKEKAIADLEKRLVTSVKSLIVIEHGIPPEFPEAEHKYYGFNKRF